VIGSQHYDEYFGDWQILPIFCEKIAIFSGKKQCYGLFLPM
jgi:hypothetical protein